MIAISCCRLLTAASQAQAAAKAQEGESDQITLPSVDQVDRLVQAGLEPFCYPAISWPLKAPVQH